MENTKMLMLTKKGHLLSFIGSRYTRYGVIAVAITAAVFVVGGIGGVFFERYIVPHLRTFPAFKDCRLFAPISDNITIVNKTEQITVTEGDSVGTILTQIGRSMVLLSSLESSTVAYEKRFSGQNSFASDTSTDFPGMVLVYRAGVFVTNDGIFVTVRHSEDRVLASNKLLEKDEGGWKKKTTSKLEEDRVKYTVRLPDGTVVPATLLYSNENTGLSLFRAETEKRFSIVTFVRAEDILPGKKTIAVGVGSLPGEMIATSVGITQVTNSRGINGAVLFPAQQGEMIFLADRADKAAKNLPLFDYRGEFVGLSTDAESLQQMVVLPSTLISNTIRRFLSDPAAAQIDSFGAKVSVLTPEDIAAGDYGSDIVPGAVIVGGTMWKNAMESPIQPDTPAARYGLLAGDIIIAVSDQKLSHKTPVGPLFRQISPETTLTVVRGGERIILLQKDERR